VINEGKVICEHAETCKNGACGHIIPHRKCVACTLGPCADWLRHSGEKAECIKIVEESTYPAVIFLRKNRLIELEDEEVKK